MNESVPPITHISRGRVAVSVTCLALVIAGCSDLTRVSDPTVISPTSYDNASGALLRRAGAIRDFYQALSQQAYSTGLISDELLDNQGAAAYADRRDVSANAPISGAGFPYPTLSNARLEAILAIQTLQEYPAAASSRTGELFALVGYVETYFAENLCSGVPLASVVGGRPVIGPTLSTSQLYAQAEIDFDSAARYAVDTTGAPDSNIVYLAWVGKARVLLDNGDWSAAGALASQVSAAYGYAATFSNTQSGQQNQLGNAMYELQTSVSEREGENGLDFVTAGDPRVQTNAFPSYGPENLIGYQFSPYIPGPYQPIIVASGTEAQLIVAEAMLQIGNVAGWRGILSALRTAYPDTALSNHPIPDDSSVSASAAMQVSVHFRERAFWLFLTGHRHGDMRRLIRQYQRPTETVFPTGPYSEGAGLSYGTDVTFVPYDETGNTGYQGCLNRSA